jgi:hypothetical protein
MTCQHFLIQKTALKEFPFCRKLKKEPKCEGNVSNCDKRMKFCKVCGSTLGLTFVTEGRDEYFCSPKHRDEYLRKIERSRK